MSENISRRRFISLSAGGIVTAALSPMLLSTHNALAALPPDDDEAIEPMNDAGSWFTSTNPLPNGKTWNMNTVQDTIRINSIPLSNKMKSIAIDIMVAILTRKIPQIKTAADSASLASNIISAAIDKGYGNSEAMSCKTKVYYPNGGRRVSANGVTPVRYVEKHVTYFYAKENISGYTGVKKTRYKIIEVG